MDSTRWIKGKWAEDGKPILDIIPREVENVWIFTSTSRRSRPHCISVDGADFLLRTHRYAMGLNLPTPPPPPQWWWMPLDTPKPPRVRKGASSATDKA